jgi:hypothetical protein
MYITAPVIAARWSKFDEGAVATNELLGATTVCLIVSIDREQTFVAQIYVEQFL